MPKPKTLNWEKEFDERFNPYNLVFPEIDRDKLKVFIHQLLSSQQQEIKAKILAKIDRVYKKEKGIHNWLDLRDKLNSL